MLKGFTDIHSHTLWKMDDGASSFGETLDMCSIAEECETSRLFVTPHLMYWDQAEELCDLRDEKADYLSDVLEDHGSELEIVKGFEILCDDEIFDIKYFRPYTLNESRYILIEFDFFKTRGDDVLSWCRYLKSFGLVPVIAHPERYGFVINDPPVLDRLSEMGALFQVNAGSPVGVFGDDAMNISCKMFDAGYVDFLGSDAHKSSIRNTDMLSFFEDYPYNISEDEITRIAVNNADFIISDKILVPNRKKSMKEM